MTVPHGHITLSGRICFWPRPKRFRNRAAKRTTVLLSLGWLDVTRNPKPPKKMRHQVCPAWRYEWILCSPQFPGFPTWPFAGRNPNRNRANLDFTRKMMTWWFQISFASTSTWGSNCWVLSCCRSGLTSGCPHILQMIWFLSVQETIVIFAMEVVKQVKWLTSNWADRSPKKIHPINLKKFNLSCFNLLMLIEFIKLEFTNKLSHVSCPAVPASQDLTQEVARLTEEKSQDQFSSSEPWNRQLLDVKNEYIYIPYIYNILLIHYCVNI